MRMFLYHFGYHWYPIQLMEVMDKSIAETEFVPTGSEAAISLFDYVMAKAGKNAPPWIRNLDSKQRPRWSCVPRNGSLEQDAGPFLGS